MRALTVLVCGLVASATWALAEPTGTLLEEGSELFLQRHDLGSLERCIELHERALETEGEHPGLAVMLAQLWHEHAALMARQEQDAAHAVGSLKTSADYAVQAMGLDAYVQLERMSVPEFEAHMARVDNPGALLWAGDSWGKILNTNRWHALRVNAERKTRLIYQRLLGLDETFFGAAGHRGLGALEAELATFPLFGGMMGSIERARGHFESALALAPGFLMNYVEYADKLAEPRGEWELFDQLLHHVLQSAEEPQVFWNRIAKREALELLQRHGRPLPPEA